MHTIIQTVKIKTINSEPYRCFYENGVWDKHNIIEETGCVLKKVILGHTNRWWNKTDYLRRFLDRRITIELIRLIWILSTVIRYIIRMNTQVFQVYVS